jgi:hypothetical protein
VSRSRGLPASLAAAFAVVAATGGLGAACNSARTTNDPPPAASTVPVKAPALPADHLAPDELLEGSAQVFGITLPQGMKVDATFTKLAYASGPVALHPLVDYFRARLQNGGLREGEGSATFEHVTAPGKSEPALTVHLGTFGDVVRVVIRDETVPVLPPLPDDPARFKRAGLTPSGRVLDPTHLD